MTDNDDTAASASSGPPTPDGPPAPSPSPRPGQRRAFGHTGDRSGVVEVEAAAIRDAAGKVLAGATLASIVREWNGQGLRTTGGGPWRVNSLSSLLVQPRLAGLPGPGARWADAPRPLAIIDDHTHAELVRLHMSRRKGVRRSTRRYLLTGLLRCWRCGGRMRGMPRPRLPDLYVCPGPPHGGCSGAAVTADHADDVVRDLVMDRIDSVEFAALGSIPRPTETAGHDAASRVAQARLRLADLGDIWASGEITRLDWHARREAMDEELHAAERRRLVAPASST